MAQAEVHILQVLRYPLSFLLHQQQSLFILLFFALD